MATSGGTTVRRGFEGHAGKGISRVDLSRSVLDVKIELCEL